MHLESTTRRRADVTLVELVVTNEADEDRRVRVENCLDGPVWYPRRSGRAAHGWDESGYEGVVPAGDRRALGYACPAPASDPPARVAVSEPAAGDDPTTAADVLADLGDPRPPRDAVPVEGPPEEEDIAPAPREPDAVGGAKRSRSGARDRPDAGDEPAPDRPGGGGRPGVSDGEVPRAVAAWLDAVERRLADGATSADRRALAAVADRAEALRRRASDR
ncbi:MAG: hypothetical protein ABEJ30_05270 [Halorientalis sp.]